MAYSGAHVLEGHRGPRRHLQSLSSASGTRNDWRVEGPVPLDSLPHRARSSGRHIESARWPSPASAAAAAAPRHVRPRPLWTVSSPADAATMPVLTRPPTVDAYQRPGGGGGHRFAHHPDYSADDSPSGARKSLRRDVSPPSARHYRTTPDTTQSSRTSVCESDGVSEITAETHDERHGPSAWYTARQGRERRQHVRDMIEDSPSEGEEDQEDEELPTPPREWAGDRHSPVRYRSRQSSRHPSEMPPSESSVRYVLPRRSHSAIEESRAMRTLERRMSRKDGGEIIYVDSRPPPPRRSNTNPVSHVTSLSAASSRRKSRVHTTIIGKTLEKPAKKLKCAICFDEFAPGKIPKLKCGHHMCRTCLKTAFKRSVNEPQEMPPKCCSQAIPLKYVEQLFSTSFKKSWNQKLVEFSTRRRLYCPYKRCGQWIKPEHIYRTEDGRKCAKCSHCRMKVCYSCSGKWHSSKKCPVDEETREFLEQAKEAGWQQCYKCKAMVELKEGCNHMTCRCGGQFCMICGSKWKSCECPWFRCDAPEQDRVELEAPARLDNRGLERLDSYQEADRSRPARAYEPGVVPNAVRQRAMSYDDELAMRKLQERQDGDVSRRRQKQREDHHRHDHHPRHHRRAHDDGKVLDEGGPGLGLGLSFGREEDDYHEAGFITNDKYRRGTQHIVVPPSPPPAAPQVPTDPFERPVMDAGGDYHGDFGRAHGGPRQNSVERRLADRLSEFRQSPKGGVALNGMNPMMGSPGALPPPPPPPQLPPPGPMHRAGPPPPPLMPAMTMMHRPVMEQGMSMGYGMPPPGRVMRTTMSDPSGMVTSGEYGREETRRSLQRRGGQERPMSSMLAGLSGAGRGMNRVFEWRSHVKPGAPDEAATRPHDHRMA